MKTLSLSDMQIRNLAGNLSVYHSGYSYYLENRVRDLQIDGEPPSIYAAVLGTSPYDVEVALTAKGEIKDYWCDCPAMSRFDGACKHVVAALIAYQRGLHQGKLGSRENTKEVAAEIINLFSGFEKHEQKQAINFEVFLELTNPNFGIPAMVEFKLGLDRLYVMKNVKEFLTAVKQQHSLEFGKNYVYEPNKHTFNERDQGIINFLLEILALERAKSSFFFVDTNSAFSGKTVKLNDFYLKKFLDLLGDQNFSLSFPSGITKVNARIQQNLPLSFSVEAAKTGLALILDSEETPQPLTSGGEYFSYQNGIYRSSEDQQKYLFPLLKQPLSARNKVIFPAEFTEAFVSEVLPFIKRTGVVKVAPTVSEKFHQEDLMPRVYFDRTIEDTTKQPGIAARLEFHYGEHIINPFASVKRAEDQLADQKIIVRDSRKEHQIFNLLEEAGFSVFQGEIHLYGEDQIFSFIQNLLPRLQQLVATYYSEDFKGLQVKTTTTYTGSVRLNNNLKLLELSLDLEDIDGDELEQVFLSLKLKKKYFRLKDGSWLDLQQSDLKNIGTMLEQLGLDYTDLQQKVIQLPQYRAMYIDSLLSEDKLQSLESTNDFKGLVRSIREPQNTDYPVPAELDSVLREYQKTGFKWLKTLASYGMGGILADDMGLGKTLEIIAFILSEKSSNQLPSLVIAPTSLVFNWCEEISKFAPSLKVVEVTGSPAERQEKFKKIQGADLIITSYPLLRRDIAVYRELDFAYCILDEAQHIKNPNTLNTKSVQQIKARNYFALTGTPIENSLSELWSIFNFIMPGYLFTHSVFQKRYELPISRGDNPEILLEFSRQVRPFILRRLKKDVIKELPDKIETKLMTDLTKDQRKVYLAYLKRAQNDIAQEIKSSGFEKSRFKILSVLTRLRQICCHPSLFIENYTGESGKMQLLEEVLSGALDSGHRILLFSQFTSMLEIIKAHLNNQGISYHYLHGSIKATQRQEMVRAFNEGEGQVFLISLKAGGTGLNLTGADMVIHYDPWWNPAVENQASDRAHRIGQKNVVQVLKLITRDTIEEKIFGLQQHKKELTDAVIQPGETFLSKMSEAELREIFDM